MIILDTNVLSEVVKQAPEQRVIDWLDAQPAVGIATTAVTAAELWYGVRRLPDGRRKAGLVAGIDAVLYEDLQGRIERFDTAAASRYADLVIARECVGQPISMADAQIAAICVSRGAVLATRNVRDFAGTGIEIVDPWAY
ncbi:type II toxin-antitoxin system VapC family toxin [Nocardia shimofusensis]|uniref:type II toxin-antitoxin system VapC family toxin n=1 Tax=Nocardia shimofusensis TaxID=228596 RepID=UPI0008365622|nr:type II toxin-antitoxin system VapC family toxin [Nocardia shimofusensis]